MKLVSRLRVININYGEILTTFMDEQSQAFDKSRNYSEQNIPKYQNGYRGKFDEKRISLNFVTQSLIAVIIALVAFILKYISYVVMGYMKFTKKISILGFKFVRFQKRMDFILLNTIIIDVGFYGTRTLLHSNYSEENFDIFITAAVYSFCVYNLTHIGRQIYKIYSKAQEKKIDVEKKPDDVNESAEFKLTEYETFKEMTEKRDRKGLRMRPFFWDYELKQVMTEYQAKVIGYVKVPSFKKTLSKEILDESVYNYATAELKDDPKLHNRLGLIMGNFFFLIRLVAYQVLLVALCFNPLILMSLLILIEIVYLFMNLKNYTKFRHFKYLHIFLSKILQSVFLLVFLVSVFSLSFRQKRDNIPVSDGFQFYLIFLIIGGVLMEYIFLIIGSIIIIVGLIKKFKNRKKEGDSDNDIVVYKWVRERHLDNEDNGMLNDISEKEKIDRDEELMQEFMGKDKSEKPGKRLPKIKEEDEEEEDLSLESKGVDWKKEKGKKSGERRKRSERKKKKKKRKKKEEEIFSDEEQSKKNGKRRSKKKR